MEAPKTANADAVAAAAARDEQRKNDMRNEVAAKVAASSRKMPSDPEQKAEKLVRVVSIERPGFSGFSRAGQMWPSDPDGRLAYVTPRMLAALKAEPMLRVDESPDTSGVDLNMLREQASLDVPVRELVDEDAIAVDDIARINREILALDARRKAEARRAVLERMKRGEDVSQDEVLDKVAVPVTAAQVVAARDEKKQPQK